MKRTPLILDEGLARGFSVRAGFVYAPKMSTSGPRHPRLEKVFHDAAKNFDLGPILDGDLTRAKLLAQDLYEHLQGAAKKAGIPRQETASFLRALNSSIRFATNALVSELGRLAIKDS